MLTFSPLVNLDEKQKCLMKRFLEVRNDEDKMDNITNQYSFQEKQYFRQVKGIWYFCIIKCITLLKSPNTKNS